jgi:hypothetical protein
MKRAPRSLAEPLAHCDGNNDLVVVVPGEERRRELGRETMVLAAAFARLAARGGGGRHARSALPRGASSSRGRAKPDQEQGNPAIANQGQQNRDLDR